MPKSIFKFEVTSSIEDASILRKFTILFLVMSVIPICVLFYLYVQLRDEGQITLTTSDFNRTLFIVVLGVGVGYWSMRSVLKQIVNLTLTNRKSLEAFLAPEKIAKLGEEKNEIAVLARSFSEITNRLEENIRSLELSKKTLQSILSKVGHGISNLNNIDTFLELILGTVTEALTGTAGILLVTEDSLRTLKIRSVYGIDAPLNADILVPIREGSVLTQIVKSKSALSFEDKNTDILPDHPLGFAFKTPLIASPLIIRDKVLGVILIVAEKGDDLFDEEAKNLLFNLASQMAVAVENSRLNTDIEKTYFETISALALAVDAKDPFSRGHLDRVSKYCVLIAEKLGLEASEIKILRDAARLHDLGKIGIPDEVLGKKGPLNHQEWLLMRKHPEIGESIIKPVHSLSPLCDLIRHHHEKLDGSGYPDGLKGDEITPLVRILTIADIFDALTSKRSYRQQLGKHKALEEMRNMNDKIDQEIVRVLEEFLDEKDLPA